MVILHAIIMSMILTPHIRNAIVWLMSRFVTVEVETKRAAAKMARIPRNVMIPQPMLVVVGV